MQSWSREREVEKIKPVVRRPPIEGMPADRPRCVWCNRPFKAWTDDTREEGRDEHRALISIVIRRTFKNFSSYRGKFDRLRCALAFAVAAHNAGYRREQK